MLFTARIKTENIKRAQKDNKKVDERVFGLCTRKSIAEHYSKLRKSARRPINPVTQQKINGFLESIKKAKGRNRSIKVRRSSLRRVSQITNSVGSTSALFVSGRNSLVPEEEEPFESLDEITYFKLLFFECKEQTKGDNSNKTLDLMIQKIQNDLKKRVEEFNKRSRGVDKSLRKNDKEYEEKIGEYETKEKNKNSFKWLRLGGKYKLLKRLLKGKIIQLLIDVRLKANFS